MPEIDEIRNIICSHYKISDVNWNKGNDATRPDAPLPLLIFVLTCARAGHSDFAICCHMKKQRDVITHLRQRAINRNKTDLQFIGNMKIIAKLVAAKDDGSPVTSMDEQSIPDMIAAEMQDDSIVNEARRLRRQGWSYQGLSKRYRITPQQAAVLVGDRPNAAGGDRHG